MKVTTWHQMVRPRIILLTFLVACLCPRQAFSQYLALLSRDEDIMVFYDLKSWNEIDRIEVGRFTHEIAFDSAATVAFVPSYGGDVLYAIDLERRSATRFPLAPHDSLHGAVSNQNGSIVWVTAQSEAAILEIDGRDGSIIKVWPTGGKGSHKLAVTLDQRKVYVANRDSGDLTVINRETGATRLLEIGSGMDGLDITPDDRELWVVDRLENTVSIVSTDDDELLDVLDAGGPYPVKLRMTPDGREAWVTHHKGTTVAIFDVSKRTLTDTIEIGRRPLAIGFNSDGTRAYVTRSRDNELVEIDTSTRRILRRIRTPENPDSVLWFPE